MLEEKVRALSRLRVYMLIESTSPELGREIGEFLSEALAKPIEVRSNGVNIAITFLWSLINKVAKQLEDLGEEVIDIEFSRGKTVIITKRGFAVNVVVKIRQNQYASEIEGFVDVEETPFRIEDF
ncbi:MAG: hypothetical protein ABWK05_01245 [Pyrobaculum sp.]